jgi:hypothetical protein
MSTNRNLLKEAIADAKTVKETAIANAKAVLEESFAPQMRSLISLKLQEMAADEDEDKTLEEDGFGPGRAEGDEGFSSMREKALDEDELEEDLDLNELFGELNEDENEDEEVEVEKSGWKYQFTSRIVINVMKYEPLRGGSYLPLPAELNNKKCCINIKNENDKCLMYCVLYHIHKGDIKDHPERVSHYKKYEDEFDWSGIKFPVQDKDIPKVEKLIDFGINLFYFDYEKRKYQKNC